MEVGLSIRSRTIHMEGSSPEDLSVGPSVINRSRTIHMEGRRTQRKNIAEKNISSSFKN